MVFELVRKAVAHLEGAGDQCESVFFSRFFGHSLRLQVMVSCYFKYLCKKMGKLW